MTTTIEKLNKIFHEAVATPSIVTNTGEYRIDEKNPLDHFINYSGILTRLIQEAGTVTAHYASDLFISWESFLEAAEEKMKSLDNFDVTTYFGFRECGVDGPVYIETKISSPEIYGSPYASIFRLHISAKYIVNDIGEKSYDVSLALTQVHRKEISSPIFSGVCNDGNIITGILLSDDTHKTYLLPKKDFYARDIQYAEKDVELSLMRLYEVNPGTLRRA